MQRLLAISGGVDSVCLLHMYRDDPDVIVAHFNHGTRPSSNDDENFVKNLAKSYGKKFIVGHAQLGENVSEEKARKARYEFLRSTAKDYQATIFTAHHLDDLFETIAINLTRGTGWRGLVPLDADDIKRPFIENGWSKNDILKYAAKNNLTFREDPTNHEDNYLRNRLRDSLKNLPPEIKHELLILYRKQKELKPEISQILKTLLPPDGIYQRQWFENPEDDSILLEILRQATMNQLTYPQLKDFLNAIRTYAPEKSFNLPGDRLVKLHKTYFMLGTSND